MTPVVNGLEGTYIGQVTFRVLNAGFGEGKEAFEAYRLPGHPSYVILDPDGAIVWQAFGPQSEDTLIAAVEDALKELAVEPESSIGLGSVPLATTV